MNRLRRLGPVIMSVVLIVATGVLALGLTSQTNTKAESLLVRDRANLQDTLAGLGKQFVLFSMKEALDYASSGTWALTPDSPADEARLKSFVANATFLNYGAALITPSRQVLDSYSIGPGLPPADNPGYDPMVVSLLAGKPDVSSVMKVGSTDVVAMGVPVEVGGQTEAVFIGYMQLDRSTLEQYATHLRYGKTGQGYVVDSAGNVVVGQDPAAIGTQLAQPRALVAIAQGRSGSYSANGVEVTYAPLGVGGWSGFTLQSSAEFFGPIHSSVLHIGIALLALLVLAAAIIIVLGHRQEMARRRFQELLAHQAFHDGLTGLANRLLLNSRLNQAVSRARRQHRGLALLYLDLDGFKPVNDRRGHEVGDEVLVAVSERLVRTVRTEDTVARIGGDEFAVLMEDVEDTEAARIAAERIVEVVGRPMSMRGQEVIMGVSVGVAYSPDGEVDGESLLRHADLAMYRAKEGGKSGYVFADEPVGATLP